MRQFSDVSGANATVGCAPDASWELVFEKDNAQIKK
jgi:hypothetical protein